MYHCKDCGKDYPESEVEKKPFSNWKFSGTEILCPKGHTVTCNLATVDESTSEGKKIHHIDPDSGKLLHTETGPSQ